jgi:polyisoprenoid-binding protein YceI
MRSIFAIGVVSAAVWGLGVTGAVAQPVTYAIDPTHTFATFEIGHFGASTNRGRFDRKSGSIVLDRTAKTGQVDVTFEAASVSTGTAAFDRHLQSADLFDVAQHPTFRFVGDRFSFEGDRVSAVSGQLTLLGKTAPVTLKATQFNCYQNPMLKREVCGGDFETVLDRTTWGMNYGVEWGFPKAVRVVVQVEGVRQ